MRKEFLLLTFAVILLYALGAFYLPQVLYSLVLVGPLFLLAFYDFFQKTHAIRRNYPLLGRCRYWLEAIRPEIQQYFIESNSDGRPFSREERSVVYRRAKDVLDTVPFGTLKDVYQTGYEWLNHSLVPQHINPEDLRCRVGGPNCKQPYNASLLNISAMSYGSLSSHAVLALNGGAKDGNFAHNTGEGGISPYHLENGGDMIWQIGTGYFGCRNKDGGFSSELFREQAAHPKVKMIEIKLSQGAKPGHGGILPADKVTKEISEIRGVPMGRDVLSPPAHTEFSTPTGLLKFVQELQELSDGKPVGFKLCVGKRREFLAICKAMRETDICPDFIVVDGGEGGTGAAPVEFANAVGTPGTEGLIFVHNALVGFDLRDRVKIIATGKVSTSFGLVKRIALGADIVYSARAFMLSLGCIQALKCNSNDCPTGVATQNRFLEAGLVVSDKRKRVHMFHQDTIASFAELLGAMGLSQAKDLRPWHIMRRTGPSSIHHYGEIYEYLTPGDLLRTPLPNSYSRAMEAASDASFHHIADTQ